MAKNSGIKKNQKTLNGRWSKSEHQRFLKGLERYGKNWVEVQKVVKTRSLTQIRSHAQKVFLNKDQNGVNQSFDGEDSDQIQYQDSSYENSNLVQNFSKTKKMQRLESNAKCQDVLRQILQMCDQSSNRKENHNTSQVSPAIQQDRVQQVCKLPSKDELFSYLQNQRNPSYFMECLASARDFFSSGGNFIDLCCSKTDENQ